MTASADGSIKIWNAETGESVIKNFGGNDGGLIIPKCFSARPAAYPHCVGSGNCTGRDAIEKLIRELTTEGAEAWSATFSPDGERVAIASADHTASVWRVPTAQQLVDQAKATVPRCLTPAERSRFFLTPQPPDWCSEKWPFNTSEWKKSPQTSRLGDMVRLLFGRASGDH
jgi:WD40 repeat protein